MWRWSRNGTGCPEELLDVPTWSSKIPDWTLLWVASSSWPCSSREFGLGSLSCSMILILYERKHCIGNRCFADVLLHTLWLHKVFSILTGRGHLQEQEGKSPFLPVHCFLGCFPLEITEAFIMQILTHEINYCRKDYTKANNVTDVVGVQAYTNTSGG